MYGRNGCANTRPAGSIRLNRKEPLAHAAMGAPCARNKQRRAIPHELVGTPMTWFKVDDSFYDHPKIFDAPDCAVALWTRAGTWSARSLTDGFVPAGLPARFCDDPERGVRELVTRGLWKRTKGGYLFHDWSVYQPTKEEVIAGRDEMSSGGSLGNHRRWHV